MDVLKIKEFRRYVEQRRNDTLSYFTREYVGINNDLNVVSRTARSLVTRSYLERNDLALPVRKDLKIKEQSLLKSRNLMGSRLNDLKVLV